MKTTDDIPHLPRSAVTGDAWDVLCHEIARICRSPETAARINPLEDAAVLEYQRRRIAERQQFDQSRRRRP